MNFGVSDILVERLDALNMLMLKCSGRREVGGGKAG